MVTKDFVFSLSETQYSKLCKWYDKLVNRKNKGSKYYGAIGGEMTFVITPTSIGSFVTVRCLGEELDISEV